MDPASIDEQWQQHNRALIACRRCPRLVEWRERTARTRRRAYMDWDYWGKPVQGFGDRQARVLVVGLAPGAHGANRTGRVFTGDSSGDFLFRALHKAGFANQPTAVRRDDGLALKDVFIAAVCRCAPPQNRPLPEEIRNCLPYLAREIEMLGGLGLKGGHPSPGGPRVLVTLGQIAFDNLLRMMSQPGHDLPKLKFGHNVYYALGEGLPWLVASYHPSRQNTQTGRLTEAMFDEVWQRVRELVEASGE